MGMSSTDIRSDTMHQKVGSASEIQQWVGARRISAVVSRKGSLNTAQMKVHQCPTCSYSSPSKTNFHNHLRTHTGEKPFRCCFCPFRATQKGSLQTHLRTHTGKKPYACKHCPYRSAQRIHLRNHVSAHHPYVDQEKK
ncbi:hypothetical protein SK128_017918 [Halocaridina rubra]|uniref:C2H2-type domain-containing protein n=1 Tax=Halocaridina rubra TaxID=373956 RepID=A0AAN9A7W1_HALRR